MDRECSICFKNFCSDTYVTNCNHKFDRICLKEWLEINQTCPLCRKDIMINDERKIHKIDDLMMNGLLNVDRLSHIFFENRRSLFVEICCDNNYLIFRFNDHEYGCEYDNNNHHIYIKTERSDFSRVLETLKPYKSDEIKIYFKDSALYFEAGNMMTVIVPT